LDIDDNEGEALIMILFNKKLAIVWNNVVGVFDGNGIFQIDRMEKWHIFSMPETIKMGM
jgi:hypothetical protein